jgi:hypothetical protein
MEKLKLSESKGKECKACVSVLFSRDSVKYNTSVLEQCFAEFLGNVMNHTNSLNELLKLKIKLQILKDGQLA